MKRKISSPKTKQRKNTVWVAIRCGDLTLILKRSASVNNPGKWNFTGGNVDPKDGILEAAIREMQEETGKKFKSHELKHVASHALPSKDVHFFIVNCDKRFKPKLNDEHSAHKWADDEWLKLNFKRLHIPTFIFVEKYVGGERWVNLQPT